MAFPTDIDSYCDWMEQMAKDHKLLQHGVDVNGSGQQEAYGEVWISSDPMEKIDFSSFFNQLRGKIKYPVLINLGASFDLDKEEHRTTNAEAMWAVLCKADPKTLKNGDGRKEARRVAEAVAKDLCARIGKYFELNVHWGRMAEKMTTEPIGPLSVDGKLYGVVVNFNYVINQQPCYDENQWDNPVTREE